MKHISRLLLVLGAWLSVAGLHGAGLPEPGLTVYGVVTDVLGRRLRAGSLEVVFQVPNRPPLRLQTALGDLNGQFSYALTVPLEVAHPGLKLSPRALEIRPAPVTVNRSTVTMGGQPLRYLRSDLAAFPLSTADRGAFQRVDFTLGSLDGSNDTDGDGLLDLWERQHWGDLRFRAEDDPDGDGMSNRMEQLAGTNPNDRGSRLEFIDIATTSEGFPAVSWSSQEGRSYRLLRSSSLLGGFQVLRLGIEATPPANRWVDSTAVGSGPFFYRIQLAD